MDYSGFITTVEQLGGIPHDRAQALACFTLNTLAQRISKGEAADLASKLPSELGPCLHREGPTATFGLDEFLNRIAARLGGADRPTAERVARAVLAATWTAVGPKEYKDLSSELPKDFQPLLEVAMLQAPPRPGPEGDPRFGRPMSLDEFLDRVAVRAGLDREGARKATEAVLEALAMRVTAGQVNDLRPFLPRELHAALDRGISRSRGVALPLSLEEFINQVTQREGISKTKEATRHAQAVISVLREAVGEKEFQDTTAQLPEEYRRTLVAQR
ncbi:DUF2267 domain-containing protein [Planosporangium mesophilum]|uniref:DUF2267 domain-containing protein n=1 Tax=Planosporangium mesophilum TaxID=689768 RepID=A0A8J3TH73_9ACTN|nr:DUF2267 domain-containing protein [Planosporangium mesophilum]NJC82542.1 DUF2267 domain-containing protein [Planosporangium mesophilum]GII25451.1 hypothetical protein Pme01_50480 [Planosporangium mesophilum]